MCTFGLSDCRVKPRRPHQTGPPGLAHDSRRTPLSAMALQHHQNSTKRPPEREKERKWRREKEKKRGAPPFGAPPFGAPLWGPHFFWVWPPTLWDPTMTPKILAKKLDWPKLDWPKWALAKIGRAKTTMAKNGLAKIGLAKIGQIRMAERGLAKVGLFLWIMVRRCTVQLHRHLDWSFRHAEVGLPCPSRGHGKARLPAMREFLGRPMLWTLCRRFAGDQVGPSCFGQEANAHVCLLVSTFLRRPIAPQHALSLTPRASDHGCPSRMG